MLHKWRVDFPLGSLTLKPTGPLSNMKAFFLFHTLAPMSDHMSGKILHSNFTFYTVEYFPSLITLYYVQQNKCLVNLAMPDKFNFLSNKLVKFIFCLYSW